jgi:hypothetical protein
MSNIKENEAHAICYTLSRILTDQFPQGYICLATLTVDGQDKTKNMYPIMMGLGGDEEQDIEFVAKLLDTCSEHNEILRKAIKKIAKDRIIVVDNPEIFTEIPR